jgi:hypothetical protein
VSRVLGRVGIHPVNEERSRRLRHRQRRVDHRQGQRRPGPFVAGSATRPRGLPNLRGLWPPGSGGPAKGVWPRADAPGRVDHLAYRRSPTLALY